MGEALTNLGALKWGFYFGFNLKPLTDFQQENCAHQHTFGEALRAVSENAVEDGQDMCERVARCL